MVEDRFQADGGSGWSAGQSSKPPPMPPLLSTIVVIGRL